MGKGWGKKLLNPIIRPNSHSTILCETHILAPSKFTLRYLFLILATICCPISFSEGITQIRAGNSAAIVSVYILTLSFDG
jgi:hypothetical protein